MPPSTLMAARCDPGPGGAGEEQGHRGDLLDGVDPAGQGLAGVVVDELLIGHAGRFGIVHSGGLHEVGLDRAGADGVAGDAVLAVLDRNGSAEGVHSGLERGVVARHRRLQELALERRDVDDPPPPALPHARQHPTGRPERRVEDPVGGLLPRLVGELADQGEAARPSSVVDEDVDRPEPFGRRVDQALDVRLHAGVSTLEEHPVCPHLCHRSLAFVRAPAADGDRGPGPEQRLRDGAPDAARSAGDHGDPAFKFGAHDDNPLLLWKHDACLRPGS